MLENALTSTSTRLHETRQESFRDFDVEVSSPRDPIGIVLITDGALCRTSPRARHIARLLRERGLSTALLDIRSRENETLSITSASEWLRAKGCARKSPIAYLGIGDGAAAALFASAVDSQPPDALALRGWIPGSSPEDQWRTESPTLVLVGSRDLDGVRDGTRLIDRLNAPYKRLDIVPGAGEGFDEPGTQAASTLLAAAWFRRFFPKAEEQAAVTPLIGR